MHLWKSQPAWVLVLLLMTVAGAASLWFIPRQNKVTQANYERIQNGMTEAEVEAILGPKWGSSLFDPYYSGGFEVEDDDLDALIHAQNDGSGSVMRNWCKDGLWLAVLFTSDGH